MVSFIQDITCRPSARPCDADECIPSLSATCGIAENDNNVIGERRVHAKRNLAGLPSTNKTTTVAPKHHHDKYDEDQDDEADYDNYDEDDFNGVPHITPASQKVPMKYVKRMPRPQIGAVPYGEVINSCVAPGAIALTFDDGPSAYTEDLLDLLDSEDVRATFFVCGGNLDSDQITGHGNPSILRRMIMSGHQIGSHTWGHPDLATMDEEQALTHMFKNEQALLSVLGVVPTYLRPPYLSTTDETLDVMDELGYHVVNLDLDTSDWASDYAAAEQNFLNAVKSSDPRTSSHIVLAHDIHERTAHEFAEFIIREGKAAGYRFVTVGECLGDPVRNWYRNPYDGGPWLKKRKGSTIVKNLQVDEGLEQTMYDDPIPPKTTMSSDTETANGTEVSLYDFYEHIKQAMHEVAPKVTSSNNVVAARGVPTKIVDITLPLSSKVNDNTFYKHFKQTMYDPAITATTSFDWDVCDYLYEYIENSVYGKTAQVTRSKVLAARSINPVLTTKTEGDFAFRGGQLSPPIGIHMEPGIIEKRDVGRFHRGGPLTTEYLDEVITTTMITVATRTSVSPTPTTTADDIDWACLPPPDSNIRDPLTGGGEEGNGTIKSRSIYPFKLFYFDDYSGGPVSKASSTLALIVAIAVMVVTLA